MDVKRTGIVLKPTNSCVVMRPFDAPSEQRIENPDFPDEEPESV